MLRSGTTVVPIPVTVAVTGNAPCSYEVSPLSASIPSTGGTNRIGVLAPPGCAWTAVSNAPWISVVSGGSGSGSGTVTFAASASNTLEARTGSLTVAGQTFSVSQAGTSLSFRLDPGSLDVRLTEGAQQAETRIVSVLPTVAGATFSAAATGGNWLTVAPATGTVPASVVASVSAAGLAVGTYRGVVTVRVPNATPPEQSIPITLTVEPRSAPLFQLTPTELTLSSTQGGEPKSERIVVSNPGTGSFTFRAAVHGDPMAIGESDRR